MEPYSTLEGNPSIILLKAATRTNMGFRFRAGGLGV